MKLPSANGSAHGRGGDAPKRKRKPRRARTRLPVETLAQAQAWVLKLLLQRYNPSLEKVARAYKVGLTTLRDYQKGRHACTMVVPYCLGLALGYEPDRLYRLTVRWLRGYLRQERRRTGKGPEWWPRLPWEQKSGQNERD